jgi:hypothetical protein
LTDHPAANRDSADHPATKRDSADHRSATDGTKVAFAFDEALKASASDVAFASDEAFASEAGERWILKSDEDHGNQRDTEEVKRSVARGQPDSKIDAAVAVVVAAVVDGAAVVDDAAVDVADALAVAAV